MRSMLRSQVRGVVTSMRRAICTAREGPRLDSQKGAMQFIDSTGGAGASRNGRSWRISELRLKSYADLHKLWFVLMKERNILLTERAWCRSNGRHWVNGPSNMYKVRRSMARIKSVVGERIRALKAKREREEAQAGAAGLGSPSGPGLADALVDEDVTKASGAVTRTT